VEEGYRRGTWAETGGGMERSGNEGIVGKGGMRGKRRGARRGKRMKRWSEQVG
jgi:hypothetical protein